MTDAPSPRRAIIHPRRPWAIMLMAFLLVVTTGTLTYALWNATGTTGVVIASGNLSIEPDGPIVWGCLEQCDTGTAQPSNASGLEAFVIAEGQTVTVSQGIDAAFVGDNLVVEMSAGFDSLPAQIEATWHIDIDGAEVSPGEVPLSDSIILPALAESPTQHLTIVISLTALPTPVLWVDPATTENPVEYDLGSLTIEADQVRCGVGSDCLAGGGDE